MNYIRKEDAEWLKRRKARLVTTTVQAGWEHAILYRVMRGKKNLSGQWTAYADRAIAQARAGGAKP